MLLHVYACVILCSRTLVQHLFVLVLHRFGLLDLKCAALVVIEGRQEISIFNQLIWWYSSLGRCEVVLLQAGLVINYQGPMHVNTYILRFVYLARWLLLLSFAGLLLCSFGKYFLYVLIAFSDISAEFQSRYVTSYAAFAAIYGAHIWTFTVREYSFKVGLYFSLVFVPGQLFVTL